MFEFPNSSCDYDTVIFISEITIPTGRGGRQNRYIVKFIYFCAVNFVFDD